MNDTTQFSELKIKDHESVNSLRPLSFADYIGQEEVKQHLSVAVKASKIRNTVLSHILLYGPPGLGKTTLATILANEMGKNIHYTNATAIEKPGDLVSFLLNVKNDGDILFIDEIHALKRQCEEALYSAMEDFYIDISIPETNGNNRTIRLDTKKFTLIGATTKPGALSTPFRDRFPITKQLKYYTKEELIQIVFRSAKIMDLEIQAEAAEEIAIRARSTARVANNLLKVVSDYAVVAQNNNGTAFIDFNLAQKALDLLKIDKLGLENIDRKIIYTIGKQYNNNAVGINNLASSVGEEKDTLEYIVEPYLIQKGLILRTSRGRILTEEGLKYLSGIDSSDLF